MGSFYENSVVIDVLEQRIFFKFINFRVFYRENEERVVSILEGEWLVFW